MKMLRNLLSSALVGMLLMGTSVEAYYGKKHNDSEKKQQVGHDKCSSYEKGKEQKMCGKKNKKCAQKHGCSKKGCSVRKARSVHQAKAGAAKATTTSAPASS